MQILVKGKGSTVVGNIRPKLQGEASRILKKQNKIIWNEIAGIMNSKGFNECETKACKTKFKNSKRSYMTCLDYNNKSGNNPMRKCANFDEMHDIFHDDDTVRPVALFSNKPSKMIT